MASNDTFTAEVPKETEEAAEFIQWEADADGSHTVKIEAAKEKIENDGIITSAKDLGDGLYEKKWGSGLRLYFAVVEKGGKKTLLILGSGKERKGKEQDKAIKKARRVLSGYSAFRGSIAKKD